MSSAVERLLIESSGYSACKSSALLLSDLEPDSCSDCPERNEDLEREMSIFSR